MTTGRKPAYYPLLDSLRAIAVAGVMISHFSPTVLRRIDTGTLGVQLFFVLSGFLITGLLLQARDRIEAGATGPGGEWRSFLVRRTLRIFPLYYGVVLLGILFNLEDVRATAPWLLSYTYNFRIWLAGGWPDRLLGHFWSLAVEEQFYLLWPLLMLCAPRRVLPWVMASMIPAALAFRIGANRGWFGPAIGQRVLLPACWDLLAAGGLMAWARHTGWLANSGRSASSGQGVKSRRRALIRGIFALGFAGFCWKLFLRPDALQASWLGRFDSTINAVFFTGVVAACADNAVGWLGPILALPPLAYLGRISYGVYVFHDFMHYFGPALSHQLFGIRSFAHEWERVLWLCACSVAAAAVSYHFYERHWLALKGRWAPAPAGAPNRAHP